MSGTVGATSLFWAPDSSAQAFVADEHLQRVGLTDDEAQTIIKVGEPASGGLWHSSGLVLYAERDGIRDVSRSGDEPR